MTSSSTSLTPLQYHSIPSPGKLSVIPTKPCRTVAELSLAYTPGVAVPCLEIQKNPAEAYKYTSKGNLVAVMTNGTAVLGLGNIGALAGKPVMEGKSVLFKRFAGIDAFDLEIAEIDPQKFVDIAASLAPTFGGINLEDIKAPECFYIEEELKKRVSIPVFHDDQHGTAVIVAASLLNALELAGKKLNAVKIVVSGAGAAAIAISNLLIHVGSRRENMFLFDSKGLVTVGRTDLNTYKEAFAQQQECSFADCFHGADVFIGVSQAGIVSPKMVQSMNQKPILFAMANPNPEITYEEAKRAVPDSIMATGRSDYPNQVNNVLGFPFIFRGALDVQAKEINIQMKLAAVYALAALAKKKVPAVVEKAYGQSFSFGSEYIIPKPFDSRLLPNVASAVAKAAMDSGVAQKNIDDWKQYKKQLSSMARRIAKGKF